MSVYRIGGSADTRMVEYYCYELRRWVGWTVKCTLEQAVNIRKGRIMQNGD